MFENITIGMILGLSLIISILMLIFSVFMAIRSMKKEGGMIDKLTQKKLYWEPFDFIEQHFDIQRPKVFGFTELFREGVREDFFYINVSDRLNLKEHSEYIAVREKIRRYETKWNLVLWATPVFMIIFAENFEHHVFIYSLIIFFVFFTIYKLRAKPYKYELHSIQKNILEKMYFYLFKEILPSDTPFIINLKMIAKVRVASNYLDLGIIINEINENKLSKSESRQLKKRLEEYEVDDGITIDDFLPDKTIIYYSKIKTAFYFILFIIFILVVAYISLTETESNIIFRLLFLGVLCLVIIPFIIESFKEFFNDNPQIVIDNSGIKIESTSFKGWSEIKDERVYKSKHTHYLSYRYKDGNERLALSTYRVSHTRLSIMLKTYRARYEESNK